MDANYVIRWVFAIGASCGAIAGILLGLDTNLSYSMGMSMTVKSVAAVILGGLGSVQGSVIGGFLLGGGGETWAWRWCSPSGRTQSLF